MSASEIDMRLASLQNRLSRLADATLVYGRVVNPLLERNEDSPAQDGDIPCDQTDRDDTPNRADGMIRNGSVSASAIVEQLLSGASRARASDVHLEPNERDCRVRYRVDGVLREVDVLPGELTPAVLSRIKVLCDMDIAEKRRPQDGRLRFSQEGRTIDVRVSSMPMGQGEKLVLRLLDQKALHLDLEDLGMAPGELAAISSAIARPQGIVLVTGPTGSGKTTTLYAALHRIRDSRVNIVTIEDPIEYHLAGINQSQVKPDIGYTFANALRAFLRQDPDVIMVGEIRDAETAQIALRAAMTGHLVLSTVHTNDAATTITRLLDLGAEPYLVASSLSLIVAQRLVRRLCMKCRLPASEGALGVYRAVGCSECLQSGYLGRIGVFEMMPIDDTIRALIHDRTPAEQIRDAAVRAGMRLLAEDAQAKWRAGRTTSEEIQIEVGDEAGCRATV